MGLLFSPKSTSSVPGDSGSSPPLALLARKPDLPHKFRVSRVIANRVKVGIHADLQQSGLVRERPTSWAPASTKPASLPQSPSAETPGVSSSTSPIASTRPKLAPSLANSSYFPNSGKQPRIAHRTRVPPPNSGAVSSGLSAPLLTSSSFAANFDFNFKIPASSLPQVTNHQSQVTPLIDSSLTDRTWPGETSGNA